MPPTIPGQTVLTDLSVAKTVTRQHKDGSWSFLVPRFFNGGTIVGGTKEPDDWRSEPDLSTRLRMLAAGRALETYAQSTASRGETKRTTGFNVLSDVVGRRPTRNGGPRLEVEHKYLANRKRQEAWVVHAYGVGGRGFEISWGVAEEVAEKIMVLLK